MGNRREIVPQGMENIRSRFQYAPGVLIGNTLYVAGQLGRDENLRVIPEPEAQMTQAFENLKKVLTAAGATFEDVVDLQTFHTDMRDLPLFMTVKNRYFAGTVPAWTGVEVRALAMPGLLCEIKCTAVPGSGAA